MTNTVASSPTNNPADVPRDGLPTSTPDVLEKDIAEDLCLGDVITLDGVQRIIDGHASPLDATLHVVDCLYGLDYEEPDTVDVEQLRGDVLTHNATIPHLGDALLNIGYAMHNYGFQPGDPANAPEPEPIAALSTIEDEYDEEWGVWCIKAAQTVYKELGDNLGVGLCCELLARHGFFAGSPELYRQQAMDAYKRCGDTARYASACVVYADSGSPSDAYSLFAEAKNLFNQIGDAVGAASVDIARVRKLSQYTHAQEALSLLWDVRAVLEGLGDDALPHLLETITQQAIYAKRIGLYDVTVQLHQDAITVAEQFGDFLNAAIHHSALASYTWATDPDQADASIEAAVKLFDSANMSYEGEWLLQREADRLSDNRPTSNDLYEQVNSAAVYFQRDELDQARELYMSAREGYAELPAEFSSIKNAYAVEIAGCNYQLAHIAHDQGHLAAAKRLLKRARKNFTTVGHHQDADACNELLTTWNKQ